MVLRSSNITVSSEITPLNPKPSVRIGSGPYLDPETYAQAHWFNQRGGGASTIVTLAAGRDGTSGQRWGKFFFFFVDSDSPLVL